MMERMRIGIDEVAQCGTGRASPSRRLVVGIDEVGRGALAGPVVLVAVAVRGRMRWTHPMLGRIRDSKRLTTNRREVWARYLTKHPRLEWRVARISHRVIDRINIARAANLGAYRLVKRLSADSESSTNMRIRKFVNDSLLVDEPFAFLDGGLKLPFHIAHRVVIKGDERLPIIAAASIIAKVWRDRFMVRLARRVPHYGFELHKGYPTAFHRRQILRHGLSTVHRRTFRVRD